MILASPPCECWSGADCDGRIWKSIDNRNNRNITTIQIKNFSFYKNYNKKCHKNKKRFFYKKTIGMLQGIGTITATMQIIEEFKPKFWFIENPKTSMIWKWIKSNYETKHNFFNSTNYVSYDNTFSLKPTIFYGNKKLNLNSNRKKGNKKHMSHGSYQCRSRIPGLLIKEIVNETITKV